MPSTLVRGSKGKTVSKLQARLRQLGFDSAEEFGPATEAAVIEFQELHGLMPDGKVGPLTWEALKEGLPAVTVKPQAGLVVDRSLRLTAAGGYLQEAHPKDLIVLHHTAGGSAPSTFTWWQDTTDRIATAYIVERDGTIFEVFDPRHWAYHLGLKGAGGRVDRRSIGIEIASEGGLTEADGALYKFDKVKASHRFKRRDAYDHRTKWRGYRYFARYTPDQIEAVALLVDHLCATFHIARRTPRNHVDFDKALWDSQGIVGHQHVRSDKSDVHPGFDWERLRQQCALTLD